ncbi:HoxN/HupN/NixA family nickel/cobalt transporter [Actinoplanes flavus]|uniref:SDR family NAD(P)-dependent oxidoreductase n=1 Tax=Actinoplanes flavus TaxID=2820290 RepID=A0ABS3UTB6_9ACTN|nr:SDR family NAD(P)-dependent oxidoreductase [Actinoplanes flavus]MBO3741838.1 SDR family NAD(P)-dependent oxidoreductase [Actinoplanes flavus]
MADKGNRGSLAVMAGVVVLLHLAGFWALDGLPPQFPLGVFVVAYLLGMRWAFEPGTTAAIDRATAQIPGRGTTVAGFWYALGFSTAVYVMAVLFTMGLQMLAWRDRPVILDGSFTGVFLGIFGILQFVALIGAVRMRRDGAEPPTRLGRLLGWVRRSWHLYPVGLILGFGLFLAVEVGLLILAAGQLTLIAPMYLTWVLPMVFAAGMSLAATVQSAAGDRIEARRAVLDIALTAVTALAALIAAAMRVFGPLPDGAVGAFFTFLGNLFLAALRLLGRLLNYLLDRPGLLLLLLIVLVAVVALRRRGKGGASGGAAPARSAPQATGRSAPRASGPAKPGLGDRLRQALRDRKEAGARKKAVRDQEKRAREREKAAQRAREEAAARSAAPAPRQPAGPGVYAQGRATPGDRPRPARAAARPVSVVSPQPAPVAAPQPVRASAAASPPPARTTAAARQGRSPVAQPTPVQPVAAAPVGPLVQPVAAASVGPLVQPVAAASVGPVVQPVAVAPVVQPVVYGQPVIAQGVVADLDHTEPIVAEPLPREQTGIAIVTGAGAGLGRAIVLGLAGAGYGILAADLDADSAAACAAQARGYGVPAQAVRPDVRQPGHLERIVAVADEWGGPVVLVNAGAGGWPSPVPGRTAEMHLTDLTRESMRIRGGGAILNVVPSASADTPALVRFTADRAGDRDGVRIMCLTTDQPFTTQDEAVTAVLDLIRHGRAGTVVALQSWNPTPGTVPLP